MPFGELHQVMFPGFGPIGGLAMSQSATMMTSPMSLRPAGRASTVAGLRDAINQQRPIIPPCGLLLSCGLR